MAKKREVEMKDAKEITKNYGCVLMEASAKADINIQEIFFSLLEQMISKREPTLSQIAVKTQRCILF